MTSHTIPVFKPTWDEFKNFTNYIKTIEAKEAHKAGICKIIPPKEWLEMLKSSSKYNPDTMDKIKIDYPLSQTMSGRSGYWKCNGEYTKSMTVKEYKNQSEFSTPPHENYDELERNYWKNLQYGKIVVYGAGVEASLMDKKVTHWNFKRLGTILDLLFKKDKKIIGGVNTPWLYFGSWKTTFAWHTEDTELYSINYLHFGEPKTWYGIPVSHSKKFEQLVQNRYSDEYKECPGFLRHKQIVVSPITLRKNGIPVGKINQGPGEIIITFPNGYHSGYNNGFNCAESTNFAMERWIEYGKRSEECICHFKCVHIKMDTWIRKFQGSEIYKTWMVEKNSETPKCIRKRQMTQSKDDTRKEKENPGKKPNNKRSKLSSDLALVPWVPVVLRRSTRINNQTKITGS